jgi:uncharacterized membrane protein
MNSTKPKLMTRGKLVLCVAAVTAGASLSLIREYRATGAVSTQSIVFSLIAFCVGIAIVLGVRWWANRPEPGDSNE